MADLAQSKYGDYLTRIYPWSHFLGIRSATKPTILRHDIPDALFRPGQLLHSFIASFIGIGFLQFILRSGIFANQPMIGAFGASVVLGHASYTTPFSQPRSVIGGNVVAAFVGICYTKLFLLNPTFYVYSPFGFSWLCGSLSVATAICIMDVLNVIHPPAGATALIATVDSNVVAMGWLYLLLVLVSSLIIVGWGIVVNNVANRRYPQYWFSPAKLVRQKAATTIEEAEEREGSIHAYLNKVHVHLQRSDDDMPQTMMTQADLALAHDIVELMHVKLSAREASPKIAAF